MPHYDPTAPELLADYGEIFAFLDLRGGQEYETEFVAGSGKFDTTMVNAVVLCALRRGSDGGIEATDLIELDEAGVPITVWFHKPPLKAMADWEGEWEPEPIPPNTNPDEFVRGRLSSNTPHRRPA